jgi:cyclopropane fatty-acyl-phospholipid synthase-like methyltransferase
MDKTDYQKFENLTFDDFRRMATDRSLTKYERIGFPNSYRQGKEASIFADITEKLSGLSLNGKTVLEIGPGCSELPLMLIGLCRKKHHQLILVDSAEMLSYLPDEPFIKKIAARYPDCADLFAEYAGKIDVILAYSVLHYIFAEANVCDFLDHSLRLLTHDGRMLIGDVPNISKRRRFFRSPAGIRFHQEFTQSNEVPDVSANQTETNVIDDSVVISLLTRAREQGFDAYLLPQSDDLPLANRREDILFRRL